MDPDPGLVERAAVHAALGDPLRLSIVDELAISDRTPTELAARHHVAPNLLAHHLDVLEDAGGIRRRRCDVDGRRRFVQLRSAAGDIRPASPSRVLFVCTANTARSQLAAALWRELVGVSAASAGTEPAATVHPAARQAARRCGLSLDAARPRRLGRIGRRTQVITVCDQARRDLGGAGSEAWHWSMPDPVPDGRDAAFDAVIGELTRRIEPFTRSGGADRWAARPTRWPGDRPAS